MTVKLLGYTIDGLEHYWFTVNGRRFNAYYDRAYYRLCVRGFILKGLHIGTRALWVDMNKLSSQAELIEWIGPETATELLKLAYGTQENE